jgi:hypothetical protein
VARVAGDDEVRAWREDGWVLLEGLVGPEEIDAVAADLALVFPTPEDYFADPEGAMAQWLGSPAPRQEIFTWPPTGPGFRPEQHRWRSEFPLPSTALNRMCVHPSIVDFCERALGTRDLRIYQGQVSAKYAGETNYEQPMHTDRNHSWLPLPTGRLWHIEGFLYLSDVHDGNAPTHVVSVQNASGRPTTTPLIMPSWDPAIYEAERPARGIRGSYLAYRSDVFHRGVDLTDAKASRFLLNVSYRRADCDWIGYHVWQSRCTSPDWDAFVSGSTPRQLELFGFPPPGHSVWDDALLDATAARYPSLDLGPWRAGLGETGAGTEPNSNPS